MAVIFNEKYRGIEDDSLFFLRQNQSSVSQLIDDMPKKISIEKDNSHNSDMATYNRFKIYAYEAYPNRDDHLENKDKYLSNVEIHVDAIVENIADLIEDIHINAGGQRIDRVNGEQLQLFLHLTNKKISYDLINKKTIIPFNINIFMDKVPTMRWHDIDIIIALKMCFRVSMFTDITYIQGLGEKMNVSVLNIQNQFTGEEEINTTNKYGMLNFIHPVFLMYVCGVDFLKIKNVSLLIDGDEYYNTSDKKLEYTPFEKGFIIIFDKELHKNIYNNKTINFSNVNKGLLKIETDEEEYKLRIYAINYQVADFRSGMFGLQYSK